MKKYAEATFLGGYNMNLKIHKSLYYSNFIHTYNP